MRPDGEKWKYQWLAELPGGALVEGMDRPQSFARSLGRVEKILVHGPGVGSKYQINIPKGAEPVVLQFGTMVVSTGGDYVRHLPREYAYGWENENVRNIWVFGGKEVRFERKVK